MSDAALSDISPTPTDEEAAAIAVALELTWPRPVMVSEATRPGAAGAWRWSGRWWADRPGPAARRRP